jgi:hypothetical protein
MWKKLKRVPDSEKQRRLDICHTCEYFVPVVHACGNCWCYLPGKASFETSRCPLTKWKSTPL